MTRATPARYAAHQPFSQASAVAALGESGPTAADASASQSSDTAAGAASTLAGTVSSCSEWKCAHAIGAVASPQAAETATTNRSDRPSG